MTSNGGGSNNNSNEIVGDGGIDLSTIALQPIIDGQLTLQLPDSTTILSPQIDDTTLSQQILIFTDKKFDETPLNDDVANLFDETQTCQFMITNVPNDNDENDDDMYNLNAKQYKMPLYGLYPSL